MPSPWPEANRRLLLGQGAPIDPLIRLETFDDVEFERFVWEWAKGYIAHRYFEVQHRGGTGDKGRDLVAWRDDSSSKPRRWDLYQCKRYKDPLTPSDFLVEIGKLCYYTHRNDYTIPGTYFIVSPKGVGNSLQDLIDDPSKLKSRLVEKWDDRCLKQITSTEQVVLAGDFRKHVEEFNFSIVKTLSPATLIEQHKETKEHLVVFGNSFKPRPAAETPPTSVAARETVYVASVYEAFADHLKAAVASPQDFSGHAHLADCFSHARECFYCAESLKEFSRDNLPDDKEFANLSRQVLQGVRPTLNKLHQDGYEKRN